MQKSPQPGAKEVRDQNDKTCHKPGNGLATFKNGQGRSVNKKSQSKGASNGNKGPHLNKTYRIKNALMTGSGKIIL